MRFCTRRPPGSARALVRSGLAALASRGLLLRRRPALLGVSAGPGALAATLGRSGRVRDPGRALLRHALVLQGLILLLVLDRHPVLRSCGWPRRAGGDHRHRPGAACCLAGGALVHACDGDLGQRLVGSALLVESLLQKRRRVVLAELLGQGTRGAVGGDLVVLDAL